MNNQSILEHRRIEKEKSMNFFRFFFSPLFYFIFCADAKCVELGEALIAL
jgi:hypothetical protein